MWVQQVLTFIKSLQEERQLIVCDVSLLQSIILHFKESKSTDLISQQQKQFLVGCYKSRWNEIRNGEYDYTLSIYSVNHHWIDFAKKLAEETQISYLRLLMHTVVNEKDPHDNSLLTETQTITNFYLVAGNSGDILYRKLSFGDWLISQGFYLSTRRPATDKSSIVTLEELSRLRRCQGNGEFSIGNEPFESFWSFLQKKIFTNLTSKGKIPVGLCPHLLELIESYYAYKSEGKDTFSDFKNEVRRFFNHMYDHELFDVNFLYGQPVIYKNQQRYLLDVFSAIFDAKNFSLDEEMKILSKFLFQFHPGLKARSAELQNFYQTLTLPSKQEQALAYWFFHCLLVSFYVTKFKITLFSGQFSIDTWDIENSIPGELKAVYTTLQHVFTSLTENPDPDYAKLYANLINTCIAPKIEESTFWDWFTRDASTSLWLEQVKNSNLFQVGGYWFQPELILSSLLNFRMHTTNNTQQQLDNFLDALLNAYAQNKYSEFDIQLRVNILFSQFLATLKEAQRRNLILSMILCDKETAMKVKAQFINNCASHINNRISSFGYISCDSSPSFFSAKSDVSINLPPAIKSVLDLINHYNNLPTNHLSSSTTAKIVLYFLNLKTPVLTIKEKESAQSILRRETDYIGSPT